MTHGLHQSKFLSPRSAVCAAIPCLVGMSALADSSDPFDYLPTSVEVTGTVRDFRDRQTADGHPDFNMLPEGGAGHYYGIVQDELDSEGNPVFASRGYLVLNEWRDEKGRNIIRPKDYILAKPGDMAGSIKATTGGAVKSAESFSSWYKDVLGDNMSGLLTIVLNRIPNTNVFLFDDDLDTQFVELEGFYNPNGQFPNAQGGNKNWSFTYELELEFKYQEDGGQIFTFAGDDDLWVFVDGKLVVDIGGVHGIVRQTIEMDRLTWLEDGQTYPMKIFFAERYKPRSNFRIETTLNFEDQSYQPTITPSYD